LWTREPSDVLCQALNDEEYEKRIQFISQTLKQIGKQLLQEATRAVQMDERNLFHKSRRDQVRWWRCGKQNMDQVDEATKETQEELRKQIQESKERLGQGASRWMDSWRGLAEEAKQLEQDAVELHKGGTKRSQESSRTTSSTRWGPCYRSCRSIKAMNGRTWPASVGGWQGIAGASGDSNQRANQTLHCAHVGLHKGLF